MSADPLILTVIAVFASILGLTLAGYRPLTDWNSLAAWPTTAAFTGFVSAPILAAVAFNVYEHTSLGKAFQMNLGWRSALLIGTLCGLMEERILTALKALLGSA